MSTASRELKARKALRGANWLQRVVRWLNRRMAAKVNRLKHDECHKIAMRICWMGFDNPDDAQRYINAAKDNLYSAALCFKAEADKPSNVGDSR